MPHIPRPLPKKPIELVHDQKRRCNMPHKKSDYEGGIWPFGADEKPVDIKKELAKYTNDQLRRELKRRVDEAKYNKIKALEAELKRLKGE